MIKDLQARQGNVNIVVDVVDVSTPREFNKFGKAGRVANATVKDSTGTVKLTLWNDEVDVVQPGTTIRISNGYVNEYQGELQLTAGKFGKIEPAERSKEEVAAAAQEVKPAEPAPKQASEGLFEDDDMDDIDVEEEDVK